MPKERTLQVLIDGCWRDAAGISLVGEEEFDFAPMFLHPDGIARRIR